MNPLERTLIEKAGHDNGFEYVMGQDSASLTLASACHRARVIVTVSDAGILARFQPASPALLPELNRSFSRESTGDKADFAVPTPAALGPLLRRAASLSQALPNQAAQDYAAALKQELALLPPGLEGTEAERLVRQRVGQERFREALFEYWGGACAVTGATLPEVLRASHAMPWAECSSDAERLDVFNGFLLVANLDALFDRFLISFDDAGGILISPRLPSDQLEILGIHRGMALRWLSSEHEAYLAFHRARFIEQLQCGCSRAPE